MNTQTVTLLENETDSIRALKCPFLGLDIDPHTSIAYPSTGNVCHRTNSIQSISQTHQAQFCLSKGYESCPTFRDVNILVSDIDIAPIDDNNWGKNRPLKFSAIVVSLLILVVSVYAIWPRLSPQNVDASPMVAISSTTTKTEQDVVGNVQPTPTLMSIAQLPATELPHNNPTATAVANTLAKSKQVTSTPIATATAVVQPTNTPQPTASKPATTKATSEPEITPVPTVAKIENSAPIDDNINYTYGTGIIDTGELNVRRGPGPQFNTITTVSKGQIITLTGRNGDSSWARVRLDNGVVGWIYAEFVVAEPSLDRLPFIPRAQR